MVRKLALPLVLLALMWAVPTGAWGMGAPLMKGVTPTELADLVDKSLAEDPEGKARLDAEHCTQKEANRCATPNDYFEGIRRAHPSAKLEKIEELSPYLRTLTERDAPEGLWHMDRLLVSFAKGEVKTRHDIVGWYRAFHKGEKAWFDGSDDGPILAGDCSNVVGAKIVPPKPRVKPRPRVVYEAPPAPVFYPSSHPEFGTFPRASCPPGPPVMGYPRCH